MFKDGRLGRIGQRGGLIVKQADPNRLQILAACAVIRMGWSDHERQSRWMMSRFRKQAQHCPRELREMLNDSR